MISAAMVWAVVVFFPILLSEPVTVRVETKSAEHCARVRKLLVKQLDDHRSNATVSACSISAPTVVLPE